MPQSKSPILEPHTQAFSDTLTAQGGEPLYKLSYPAACKLLEDLSMTFLLAANETPALALAWALYLLSRDANARFLKNGLNLRAKHKRLPRDSG